MKLSLLADDAEEADVTEDELLTDDVILGLDDDGSRTVEEDVARRCRV